MPELPEVETVARQLAPLVCCHTITRIRIHDPKLRQRSHGRIKGFEIAAVYRLGKQIIFELSDPTAKQPGPWLAVHLRMTGRLIYHSSPKPPAERNKRHLRATIELDDGAVFFYDARRFGTLTLHNSLAEVQPAGIDPTSRAFTFKRLQALTSGSPTPIKAWLLRQDKLVGFGNIYASEVLFAARIHPERPAGSLDADELRQLHQATKRIMRKAIRHCGTTFSDFQDARGETGGYVQYLCVYGRAGQPCLKCGTAIERRVQAQRSTFYCPNCQFFG